MQASSARYFYLVDSTLNLSGYDPPGVQTKSHYNLTLKEQDRGAMAFRAMDGWADSAICAAACGLAQTRFRPLWATPRSSSLRFAGHWSWRTRSREFHEGAGV